MTFRASDRCHMQYLSFQHISCNLPPVPSYNLWSQFSVILTSEGSRGGHDGSAFDQYSTLSRGSGRDCAHLGCVDYLLWVTGRGGRVGDISNSGSSTGAAGRAPAREFI